MDLLDFQTVITSYEITIFVPIPWGKGLRHRWEIPQFCPGIRQKINGREGKGREGRFKKALFNQIRNFGSRISKRPLDVIF